MQVVYGLISIVLGLMFLGSGYKLFRVLIPIWGFFGGFSLGASAATALFGGNFLSSGIGFLLGLVLGIIFAVMSYFFFNLAVIVLAASVGYWLGAGFMVLLGLNSGFVSVMAGVILAVVLGFMALVGNFTRLFIIILSALGGATATIAGILLIFGQINTTSFTLVAARAVIHQSTVWTIVWGALIVVSVLTQQQMSRSEELATWGRGQVIEQ